MMKRGDFRTIRLFTERGFVWFTSILLLMIIFGWISAYIVDHQHSNNADSDFSFFWQAGLMQRLGLDYYDSQVWQRMREEIGSNWQPGPFPYPVPMAVLFVPFSWLSLRDAYWLWVFLSLWMILFSFLLGFYTNGEKDIRILIFPIAVSVVLFRPVITTILGGQFGAFLLFILAAVLFLWKQQRWLAGGVLLPLTLLKPTLGVSLVALLSFWLLVGKRWKGLLGISTACAVLYVTGMTFDPGWASRYMDVSIHKTTPFFGYTPSIWGFSSLVCQPSLQCTTTIWSGTSLLFLIAFVLWVWVSRIKSDTIPFTGAITACLALLFTPYLWAYDMILLIVPITYLLAEMKRRKIPFLITGSFFLLIDLLGAILVMIAVKQGSGVWDAVITLLVFILLVLFGKSVIAVQEPSG